MTSQDVERMDEGPPRTWPPDLWQMLGFNPPDASPEPVMQSTPESPPAEKCESSDTEGENLDSDIEVALEELHRQGWPKQDYDPGNGETFSTWPEDVICNRDHPLYDTMPDNARPENWREMESANFNPSKAESLLQSTPKDREWPPGDERIDSAAITAIRSGAIGEKELATIRRTPKSQWPDSLWAALGFPIPTPSTINVRVEVASRGTFHHITRDYFTHPCEGEEFVSFDKIEVSVYDTHPGVDGQERLLRAVTFSQADGTLVVHSLPPKPPWRGTIDEVGCFSRMEREFSLPGGSDIPVVLDARGISVGDHTISWHEVTENGGLDRYYSLTAYGHCEPLGGGLTSRLYVGDKKRTGPKRAILAALVDQIDYIIAYSLSAPFGRSPVRALEAAADNPDILPDIVLSMPWERARSILGPIEFANWLQEHHPASPSRTVQPPPATPTDTADDTPAWPPDTTPLTSGGEVALNALLIGLKTKGLLTDEFISAKEGEILLKRPFLKWPPELQTKLIPHGAGPAIR